MKIELPKQSAKPKMNQFITHSRSGRSIGSMFASACLWLAALFFCAVSASAASLTWDAGNTNNGATIDPASGAWDLDTTTNIFWNNGTGNVSWTQTSTTSPVNGASFNGPDAAVGTYQVDVDGGQVAATNLTIKANGYAFSGSAIFLNGNGGHFNFFVADGKNVVISNNLTGSGNGEYVLGSNGAPASATFYGTVNGFTPYFTSTNGSIFYLAGGGGAAIGAINADVRLTNGTYTSPAAFVIARNTSPSFPNANSGSFTADGPATILNQNSDYIYLGRQGTAWNATLNIQNGATVNYQTGAANNNLGLGLPRPGSTGNNCSSYFNMYGGTLNMGPGTESPQSARPIFLENQGSSASQLAILNQTGGVINAWGGILVGGSGSGTALVTNSGGFLYIGSIGNNGIKIGTSGTNRISLSGGTVGALQNWISSAPLTLATLNGNITFQCADAGGNPWNISLSGALTGPGGFNLTGGGVLTLTGPNNYAGSTVVSNGTLVIPTANLPVSGNLVLDGSTAAAGYPLVSNVVNTAGQSWAVNNTTFAAGTPTLAFNFGGLPPSSTVAPLQANGNLAFTVTPNIVVDGTAIPTGLYPLIHYTGTLSGTPPTVLAALPPGASFGYITNIVATRTIAFYVASSVTGGLSWGVGNGNWDTTSFNWKQYGVAATYVDNGTEQVFLNDSASGTSPIAITIATAVNNAGSITADSVTKSYVIQGPIPGPGIGGTVGVTVSSGSLTVSNANTYTGGTTVSAPGLLNLNYGGTGGSDSAIGSGALSLNTGARIDNTSGHAIGFNTSTPIPINWNDDWTFVGSTNLDLGLGQVTLGNVEVQLTVVSNTLTVNNPISDNGNNYKLTKFGNGTLTLSNVSSAFSGGLDLEAGTLNINSDGSAGSGPLTLGGGTLDNTSGTAVALNSPTVLNMLANFTFKGSGNLDLSPNSGYGQINIGGNTITLSGTNAFETDGAFLGGNRNTTVNGTGSWILGGVGNNNNLGLTINGGTIYFNKASGFATSNPFQINTNAAVVLVGATGTQIAASTGVTLQGGTLELAGDTEPIGLVTFNSGVLLNSTATSYASLPVAEVTLGSGSCVFGVATADATLTVSNVDGAGGLIETGLGSLILTTNSYAGNTTISNGTLVVSFPTFATNSTITISTNAALGTTGVLTLNFPNADTNTVAALVLGGVSQPAGLYNATTDPLYISGNGNLLVVPPVLINPLPGTIQFSVSNGSLALSWPTNLGWILQSQTNSLSNGLVANSNAWHDLVGSASVTSINLPVTATNPAVFFRLRHP